MADDPYQLLGISPEADAVRQLLQPSAPPQRQFYDTPQAQSFSDYHAGIEQDIDRREGLAQQAEIMRRINLPTVSGEKARAMDWQKALEKAQYEKQTYALMEDLKKLDPADPEHFTQQDEIIAKHPIAKTALSDPRISGMVKRQSHDFEEMQNLFDKDAVSRQEYANLRTSGIAPDQARQQVRSNAQVRADRLWFAMQGGNPAEFDSGKFNGPDGRPDKARMAYYLAERKGSEDSLLSSVERKALEEAARTLNANRLNPDLDEDKKSAFKKQFGREPTSEEDWRAAYDLAKNSGGDKREAMAALVADFQRAGKSVPEFYRSMVGQTNVPQSQTKQVEPAQEVEVKETENISPQGSTLSESISVEKPSSPTDPVLDKLWADYEFLNDVVSANMSPEAGSTAPSPEDQADMAQQTAQWNQKRSEIMSKLGLKDDARGKQIFDNMVRGRNMSNTPTAGQTGNKWVIKPATK